MFSVMKKKKKMLRIVLQNIQLFINGTIFIKHETIFINFCSKIREKNLSEFDVAS